MPWKLKVMPLVACALIACAGDGPSDSEPEPGVRILAGADVTDSISTTPTQGLVVEVRGENGQLVSGVDVRFEAPYESNMLVSDVASPYWMNVAGATTDAQGRATVRVRFGERAGDGWIAILVPVHNLTDTARYTIRPGNPVYVSLAPRDTALTVGLGFTYRGTVSDRAGNARPDPATFELVGDAITLSSTGVVSARAIGAAKVRIRATVNGVVATDSGSVVVVPAGTVAWGDHLAMRVTDVMGAGLRTINSRGLAPSWEPGGNRFVATDNGLIVVDANDNVTTLPTPGFNTATWPEWSSQGFIYFVGDTPNGKRLGRVRPDGSGLEMLGDETAQMPSPSPDGTRVVFVQGDYSGPLRIFNLQTRTSTILFDAYDPQGPRWSPDGNWIAFTRSNMGELWLIRPDGTNAHRVGQHGLWPGISWSPDSRWIIGTESNTTLVDLNTGVMSYLPYRRDYPSWKR